MKKTASIGIVFIVLSAIGFSAPAAGQTPETDLIDNIKITAIERMAVTDEKEGTFLDLTVYIENRNDRLVRFGRGMFTFYLRIDKKNETDPVTTAEMLGTDNRSRRIVLYPVADFKGPGEPGDNSVDFKVDLGNEQEKILRSLKRIVNAMGDPPDTRPIFFIDGRFHLGVKSDKGWSSIPARINWAFKPVFLEEAILTDAKVPISFPDKNEDIIKAFIDTRSEFPSSTTNTYDINTTGDANADTASAAASSTTNTYARTTTLPKGDSTSTTIETDTTTTTFPEDLPPEAPFTTTIATTTTTTTLPGDLPPVSPPATTIDINYEAAPKIGALINFDYNSDVIRDESYPLLNEYGQALNDKRLSNVVIIIAGHASDEGSDVYNQDLSERRAASVKRYLVEKQKIDPNRLISTGYGESKPLVSNADPDGRKLNRRVEFIPYHWLN